MATSSFDVALVSPMTCASELDHHDETAQSWQENLSILQFKIPSIYLASFCEWALKEIVLELKPSVNLKTIKNPKIDEYINILKNSTEPALDFDLSPAQKRVISEMRDTRNKFAHGDWGDSRKPETTLGELFRSILSLFHLIEAAVWKSHGAQKMLRT
jgi:hypothetical protein